jgi:hypothetical protein
MTEFARRLVEWQEASGLTQRAMAALIGCHESRLTQLRAGDKPGADLRTKAITAAPEPWKSALLRAETADRAADLAAAQAVVA